MNDQQWNYLESIARPYLLEAAQIVREKRTSTARRNGQWKELVYCILAGTQVPVEQARTTFRALEVEFGQSFSPRGMTGERAERRIQRVLRESGYRYHRTKAKAIASAATFFCAKARGSVRRLSAQFRDAKDFEALLTASISGVGQKIANHWLRNIGYETGTIDIHLKRVFGSVGEYRGDPEHALSEEDFRYLVSLVATLAKRLDVGLPVAQLALWLGARARHRLSSMQGRLF